MKLLFQVLQLRLHPVIKLDGEPVNDGKVGPITRQLQEGFEKHIESHSI